MCIRDRRLSEAHGVSGYEGEIREVIKEYIEPYATTIRRDKLGSIIAERVGDSAGPRIMLAGHMDEIGFMVKAITPDGFIRFIPLGEMCIRDRTSRSPDASQSSA